MEDSHQAGIDLAQAGNSVARRIRHLRRLVALPAGVELLCETSQRARAALQVRHRSQANLYGRKIEDRSKTLTRFYIRTDPPE